MINKEQQIIHNITIGGKDGTMRIVKTIINPKEAGFLGKDLEGDNYLWASSEDRTIEKIVKVNPFKKEKADKEFLKIMKKEFKKAVLSRFSENNLPAEILWKKNLSVNSVLN